MSYLSIRKINQIVKLVSKFNDKLVLPARLKGGRIERLVNYGQNVLKDYRQAIQDTYTDAIEKPRKSYVYLSLIGLLTYLYKTNPESNSFKAEVINYQNLMSLVGEPIRNVDCYNYLNNLNDLDNQRLLEKFNLLFLTIFVRKEFSSNLKIYPANCKYLQPSYLDYLSNRIVDVGIANKWILLDKKLKDFDVNPDEWKTK